MTETTFRAAALLLRYPLALAGVGIAVWAIWCTVKDLRRSRLAHRELADEVAVLIVLPANKTGKGQSYPIPPSGSVGSGKGCDVVLRHSGLEKVHFEYEILHREMVIRCIGAARVSLPGSKSGPLRDLTLSAGTRFLAGQSCLRFQLLRPAADALSPATHRVYAPGKGGKR